MAAPKAKIRTVGIPTRKPGPTQQTGTPQKVPGITFGGKPLYIPGPNYFSLTLGIAPGSGTVTMKESDLLALQAKNKGFELKISDGQRRMTIPNLYIRETRHQDPVHAGEAFVNVVIEDARSQWAFTELYGERNKLREDGINYVRPSINGTKPWTFDEVLQAALDGIEDVKIEAKTNIPFIPKDVIWKGNPANSMVEALLGTFGHDIAMKPDGSFEIIDLFRTGSFKPPDGFTVWGDTNEEKDAAHLTPGTLKLIFDVFREEETTAWEPVLQYPEDAVGDTGVTAKKGEWAPLSQVVASWGITEAFARGSFYRRGDEGFLEGKFGRGNALLGKHRLAYYRGAAYRFWRFTDTDRDKKLPLARLVATTGIQLGRQTALGPAVLEADWHAQRRTGYKAFFRDAVRGGGQLPWGTRIVDGREGIIHIQSPRPLTNVEPIPGKSPFYASGFGLKKPSAPKVRIGYYKKFSVEPEDNFHVRTRAVGADNNGKVSVRYDPNVVLREVGSGIAFAAQNETEINAAADQYLREWERMFTIPQPRQVRLAGIWTEAALSADVRAITFRWESGVETNLRLWSDRTPDRYGLGFSSRLRSKKFAAQAQAAHVLLVDDVPAGGGASGRHTRGALGQTSPQMREFAESREWEGGYQEGEAIFVNMEHAGLIVAWDLTTGPSGEKCEPVQTTRHGGRGIDMRPTVTGRTVISGGPSDGAATSTFQYHTG
jgi:hypothetical protein